MTVTCEDHRGVAGRLAAVSAIYEEEKQKRRRLDGTELTQYVELSDLTCPALASLNNDPFVDHAALNAQAPRLLDGDEVKVLIMGAGFSSLITWVRLVQAGVFQPDDMCIVDQAGGFGGTWYWNRYPGLMCDFQSYMYLPFLEETGYMPKHRYSHGHEILEYANLVAEKWGAAGRAVFRTRIHSKVWDEESKRWIVSMVQDRGPGEEPLQIKVKSQFVVWAGGLFSHPKVPRVEGMEDFQGTMMHSCRWDYQLSGGTHGNPELTKLKGKRVGIVGTGATAVQLVPELAKWADELYVFQRTPAGIDMRGQAPTDEKWFREMSAEKGWGRDVSAQWQRYFNRYEDAKPVLHDGWNDIKGFLHFVGGYHEKSLTLEEVPGLVQDLMREDLPRLERLRAQIDTIVKDKKTADGLKPWYPSWCKRPLFHDEYLSTFNRPNVTLVDTAGKGISRMTGRGVVANDEEFELDFVVFSTGYRPVAANWFDPSLRTDCAIVGRDGLAISDKWATKGPSSMHSAFVHGFPNMMFIRPDQSAVSPNFLYGMDVSARHVAHVLCEAFRRVELAHYDGGDAGRTEAGAGGRGISKGRMTVEATERGEDEYVELLLSDALWGGPLGVCGPNYSNLEGSALTEEGAQKMMRSAAYMRGCVDYERMLEEWRAEGSLQGLDISW
ncbi:Pentalenolactone D synthase [Escovopsis weberi]|uniref:Pentalenolactone D synthase n=1 Tax=Escovopsis weberi TaxID=150374 RepID=A0A0N0RTQ6_ESCWE|nr:Pentalenolactone D synthase [Escovopsis weberi]